MKQKLALVFRKTQFPLSRNIYYVWTSHFPFDQLKMKKESDWRGKRPTNSLL